MTNKDLIKLYAESCTSPIGEYQFSKLSQSSYLQTIFLNTRMSIMKNLDHIEDEGLNIRDYEYQYLTNHQKMLHTKYVARYTGLSNTQYYYAPDIVRIEYVKEHKSLDAEKIKLSSIRVLKAYIDTCFNEKGYFSTGDTHLCNVLRIVNNPEVFIKYINDKGYKGSEDSILNELDTMLSNTHNPIGLISEFNVLLQNEGWYDGEWDKAKNSCTKWLDKGKYLKVIKNSWYPRKIFKNSTDAQKNDYLNNTYDESHPINFISMLFEAKNPASILEIFGTKGLKFIKNFLDIKQPEFWKNNSNTMKMVELLINNLYLRSAPNKAKVNSSITKELYDIFCNSNLSYKIISYIKDNNIKDFEDIETFYSDLLKGIKRNKNAPTILKMISIKNPNLFSNLEKVQGKPNEIRLLMKFAKDIKD